MLQALHEGLTKDVNDCSLRAIVISAISTGTPSVFSSGHNLKELRMGEDNSLKLQKEIFDTCSKVMLSIKESPVPVICEVNGLAAAAGCQLAASCDIVIASSNSTFSTPGANFGLFCSTPGIAVARSANPKLASMMLITGLPVTAGEALAGGLVSAVVPEHEVRVKTEKILDAIISKSRPVVEQGRRFLQKQVQVSDLTEAYCIGTEEMLDNLRLQDCQEGLNAFAEKRKPIKMEAVPRLPMLSFKMNTSTETSELSSVIKPLIAELFGEDPVMYSSEMRELDSLRATAVLARSSVEESAVIKRYYSQLHFLALRFPPLQESTHPLKFSWRAGNVANSKAISLPSLKFEMANVLFNIGAIESILGAENERADNDGLKAACFHFQVAAWVFETLLTGQEFRSQQRGNDMPEEHLLLMRKVMLAQAQECLLEKSMLDHRKNAAIVKIAHQIVEFYREAQKLLDKKSGLSETVESTSRAQWLRYAEFKEAFYNAVTYLYRGLQAEDESLMGQRQAFYQAASGALETAGKLTKGLWKVDRWTEALTFTSDIINGKLNAAKKENEFIYHEPIPELKTLPPSQGVSLVKGIPLDVSSEAVSGGDLLKGLISLEAHQASSMYSEEKAKLWRSICAKIREKDDELESTLNSYNLDHLDNLTMPEVLPPELVEACATLSVHPDAADKFQQSIQEHVSKLEALQKTINSIEELLRDDEDQEMDFQKITGPRQTSTVLREIGRELKKYQEVFQQVTSTGETLRKALDMSLPSLQLLMSPLQDLQAKVPSVRSLKTEEVELRLKRVQELMAKVDEMRRQRSFLASQLQDSLQSDDITKKLIAAAQTDLESVFASEMKKHSEITGLIEQNMKAQGNILSALADANAELGETRMGISATLQRRNEVLGDLMAAAKTLKDLEQKLEEGKNFCKKLDTNLNKLLSRAKSVVQVQAEERGARIQLKTTKATPVPPPTTVSQDTTPHRPPSAAGGATLKDILEQRKLAKSQASSLGGNQQHPVPTSVDPRSSGEAASWFQGPQTGAGVNTASQPVSTTAYPAYTYPPTAYSYPQTVAMPTAPSTTAPPQSTAPPAPVATQTAPPHVTVPPATAAPAPFPPAFGGPSNVPYSFPPATAAPPQPYSTSSTGETKLPYSASAMPNGHAPGAHSAPHAAPAPHVHHHAYYASYTPQMYNSPDTLPSYQKPAYSSHIPTEYHLVSSPSTTTQAGASQAARLTSFYATPIPRPHPGSVLPTVQPSHVSAHPGAQYYTPPEYGAYQATHQTPIYIGSSPHPQMYAKDWSKQTPTSSTLMSTGLQATRNPERLGGPVPAYYSHLYGQQQPQAIPPRHQPSQHQQPPHQPPQRLQEATQALQHHQPPHQQLPQYQHPQASQHQRPLQHQPQQPSHQTPQHLHQQPPQPLQHQPPQPLQHQQRQQSLQHQPPHHFQHQPSQSQQPCQPQPSQYQQPLQHQPPYQLQYQQPPPVDVLLSSVPPLQPTSAAPLVPKKVSPSPDARMVAGDSSAKAISTPATLIEDLEGLTISSLPTTSKQEVSTRVQSRSIQEVLQDPENRCKFEEEVDSTAKMVGVLESRSLNGPSQLDTIWRKYLEGQDSAGRSLPISVARCYPNKNRCPDTLPYDATRVELRGTKDDYINASHLKDSEKDDAIDFIVTQVPLPQTVEDFWTMVWESQSEILVSLLTVSEYQRANVSFFPVDRSQPFAVGPFEVVQQNLKKDSSTEQLTLLLRHKTVRSSRSLVMLRLLDWESSEVLSSFSLNVLRTYRQQRSSRPVVVHCFSGVGMTGVFALLVRSLAEIEKGMICGFPDVLSMAINLSHQRRGILQSSKEFLRVYEAILCHCWKLLGRSNKVHQLNPSLDKSSDSATQLTALVDRVMTDSKAPPIKEPTQDVPPPIREEIQDVAPPPDSGSQTALFQGDPAAESLGVTPQTFHLMSHGEKPKSPRTEFEKRTGNLLNQKQEEQASVDPLSSLDPLWTLKSK
ncbi:unnamed protein product [Cyprideis torosa]|uniref:Uncharacterized protein n=1 Tax=Cyprideis torosa TaxID=163714 RepID=A0A7R8WBP4_9CRUS|nr:unnamed protein product [Cyprideis torosa]CAG0887196.1 unnamed protein product [Cyprideis torosa]